MMATLTATACCWHCPAVNIKSTWSLDQDLVRVSYGGIQSFGMRISVADNGWERASRMPCQATNTYQNQASTEHHNHSSQKRSSNHCSREVVQRVVQRHDKIRTRIE